MSVDQISRTIIEQVVILKTEMSNIRCAACGVTLGSVQRLEEHLQNVHFMPIHICSYCRKALSSHRSLEAHIREKHHTEKKSTRNVQH